jgi:hypothetical protein
MFKTCKDEPGSLDVKSLRLAMLMNTMPSVLSWAIPFQRYIAWPIEGALCKYRRGLDLENIASYVISQTLYVILSSLFSGLSDEAIGVT